MAKMKISQIIYKKKKNLFIWVKFSMKIFYRKPHGLYNCQGVIRVIKSKQHIYQPEILFFSFAFKLFITISHEVSQSSVFMFMHPFMY